MAPTLYYTMASPPVRSVLLTAKAIGLELDLKSVNLMAGEHMSEEFLKINPQHTVPTMVDGDFAIWDSHAIITYLISKYAKDDSLYPKDLQKRAKIDQRLHFDSGTLFPAGRNMAMKIFRQGATEIEEADRENVYNVLNFIEKFLEKDLYLVGNTLTVADFSCVPMLGTFSHLFTIDEQKYPKVNSYLKRMAQLPYYEAINGDGIKTFVGFLKKKMEDNKAAKSN